MSRRYLAMLAVLATLPAAAQAQTATPVLRLETEMHTAPIRSIDVDDAGRILVTGSHDKTVRVWDLESGALLRVLRPPIGDGDEGKIYAVALSGDGNTVAAGGWTSPDGLNNNIYVFDRRSGRLRRRIPGLPNVVHHLVFDHDGTRLAATLGDAKGLRLFRAADGEELGRDTAYGGQSYGANFDAAGRLVTTSYDGHVRLYGRDLALLAKQKAPGGANRHGAACPERRPARLRRFRSRVGRPRRGGRDRAPTASRDRRLAGPLCRLSPACLRLLEDTWNQKYEQPAWFATIGESVVADGLVVTIEWSAEAGGDLRTEVESSLESSLETAGVPVEARTAAGETTVYRAAGEIVLAYSTWEMVPDWDD